jgi:phosphohistidine swiveling domain-containing protein
VSDGTAGGKATGLARLLHLGFAVPPGFVVRGLEPDAPLPSRVLDAYRELGAGPVAVRSSAMGEDGAEASFAGQFETVLHVDGERALADAVRRCTGSLHAARARAYGDARAGRRATRMCVIVQRMVDARAAGVVFTVDAATMRRDRVPVEAVQGLGEALVSGHAVADRYEASRDGRIRRREVAGSAPVLEDEEVARIVKDALTAEAAWGEPLDLEWAVDRAGRLWWLQARSVTTPLGDLHEFDVDQGADHVLARFNIGEMMPGAVTPLTLSTTVRGIDLALQTMLVRCGTRRERTERLHLVAVHWGHLFFDFTGILDFARQVGGVSRESMIHSMCGRDLPELPQPVYAPAWVRAINGARYLRYVLEALVCVDAQRRRVDSFRIPRADDAAGTFRAIDAALPFLHETYVVHIQSSAGSGFGSGVIEGILARGKLPTPAQEAAAAALISGAGEVESADLLLELERVADDLATRRERAEAFRDSSSARALAWLRGPDAGKAGVGFARFLDKHGHRTIRELELRQQGWADDPLPLVTSLQAMVGARLAGRPGRPPPAVPQNATPGEPGAVHIPPVVRWFARFARDAVRRRERSKSMLVEVTDRFKRAYRRLGELLARDGRLADADLVFFLTHDELRRIALGPDASRSALAALRRRTHDVQQALEFPEVCVGRPEPLESGAPCASADGLLQGKPVGGGTVEGPARVLHSFAEASALRPGEILVVPQTDVAWSPYYSVAVGLATDLGSPMSHGAVVAREYGLPAVTNLRTATRTFRTGERLLLDGGRGTLRRLDAALKED